MTPATTTLLLLTLWAIWKVVTRPPEHQLPPRKPLPPAIEWHSKAKQLAIDILEGVPADKPHVLWLLPEWHYQDAYYPALARRALHTVRLIEINRGDVTATETIRPVNWFLESHSHN